MFQPTSGSYDSVLFNYTTLAQSTHFGMSLQSGPGLDSFPQNRAKSSESQNLIEVILCQTSLSYKTLRRKWMVLKQGVRGAETKEPTCSNVSISNINTPPVTYSTISTMLPGHRKSGHKPGTRLVFPTAKHLRVEVPTLQKTTVPINAKAAYVAAWYKTVCHEAYPRILKIIHYNTQQTPHHTMQLQCIG